MILLQSYTKGIRIKATPKSHHNFVMIIKKSLVFHWVLGINYAKQQLQHN